MQTQTFIVRYSVGGYANRKHHEIEISTRTGALAKVAALNSAGHHASAYVGARLWTVVDEAGYYLEAGSLLRSLSSCETDIDAEVFESLKAAQAVADSCTELSTIAANYQVGPVVVRKFARIA